VGPLPKRIEKLQSEWNAIIKKNGLPRDTEGHALAASYVDKSVYNLSSIVVLAEAAGKSMMLTGDAHADCIIEGLELAGRLEHGTLHVDLLKLPHHGSKNNVNLRFFQTITADHYVISANGRYGHPDISTLQMISEARGQDDFTFYLTNTDPRLEAFFEAERSRGKKYQVIFRDLEKPSIRVDLGEELALEN
jgi:beta-lactamase superfamily II metal-dependent hydrolase